jgi:predicted enzyme related to lactoylglutathione lyase
VNAFICTLQVELLDDTMTREVDLGAEIALPKMPIPRVGWLAYFKSVWN